MLVIEEYILLPKATRQAHLRLDEPCLERGGQSMYLKGLLAHIHDTTIPSGHKIHVCHACNNALCSNPVHIYWGTAQENRLDFAATGNDKTIWERMVEKYGIVAATEMNSRKYNKNGAGNKGKPKSEEHRAKTATSISQMYEDKKKAGDYVAPSGRPRAIDYSTIISAVQQMGFNDAAVEFKLSVSALKGRYYNAISRKTVIK